MTTTPNPMETMNHIASTGNVKCSARSKRSNKRCDKWAVPGATVCFMHGGNAPQVQAAARLRLVMASETAAAQLIQIAKNKKLSPAARVSAANSILDRAGLKPDSDLQQARITAIQASVQASAPGGGDVISEIKVVLVDAAPGAEAVKVNGKVNGHG